ncbi:hypothetical protein V9T40_013327 [Parthenolecanium corni]|uniref:Uncharacterized protein n=1 Tax=Parthenolecanium corni TaxID=536013 RepID=A0AAN9TJP6_9HEMI
MTGRESPSHISSIDIRHNILFERLSNKCDTQQRGKKCTNDDLPDCFHVHSTSQYFSESTNNRNQKPAAQINFISTLEVPGGVIYDATQNFQMHYSKEQYFEKPPTCVSCDATGFVEVILVASYMTPPGPLSNRVKPGFSGVKLDECRWELIHTGMRNKCQVVTFLPTYHLMQTPILSSR